MKNSILIFVAALFMMTSCTLNQEDTPQPIDQTEQYDSDLRDKFEVSKDTGAELNEKKSAGSLASKHDHRARIDTLKVSGSALEVKKGVGDEGIGTTSKGSYRKESLGLKDTWISTMPNRGGEKQKEEPSTEGFGSSDALTVIANKHKMD